MSGGKDNLSDLIDWEVVARAETHQVRVLILELLAIDGGRTLSPREISYELQTSASAQSVIYNTKVLRERGLIRLVYERETIKGSIEHFYCLSGALRGGSLGSDGGKSIDVPDCRP
jgi:predicted transcriptional regulator